MNTEQKGITRTDITKVTQNKVDNTGVFRLRTENIAKQTLELIFKKMAIVLVLIAYRN